MHATLTLHGRDFGGLAYPARQRSHNVRKVGIVGAHGSPIQFSRSLKIPFPHVGVHVPHGSGTVLRTVRIACTLLSQGGGKGPVVLSFSPFSRPAMDVLEFCFPDLFFEFSGVRVESGDIVLEALPSVPCPPGEAYANTNKGPNTHVPTSVRWKAQMIP